MDETPPTRTAARWMAAGAGLAAAYASYVAITWRRYGRPTPSTGDEVDALLDRFAPTFDVAVRHDTRVIAPTEVTVTTASETDIRRSVLVRALFTGRTLLLGGRAEEDEEERHQTLRAWMQSLGWTVLADIPGRAVVMGTVMQPWTPSPTPRVVPLEEFAAFREPGYVKIVSTWAAEPLGPNESRFTIRTRVGTTDAAARRLFRRYWAVFSPGSLLIRYFGLGLVKREAERRARDAARVAKSSTPPGQVAVGGSHLASQPNEIAEDVFCFSTGKGITQSNVYFVRCGSSWVLIDSAWAKSGRLIKAAAEALFGANTRPAAILLTHLHPDHAGSALELARAWGVPVFVHPDELPLATGTLSAVEQYPAGPLDRWIILPLMRAMPPRRVQAMRAQSAALRDVTRAFDPSGSVPGLPDWECIPTPGHSPGHAAFFRESDRVLIAGDAVLTVNLNSLWDFLRNKQRVSGPPYISTWNWALAKESVTTLARLEPRVLACGHGIPMTGTGTAGALSAFAEGFAAPTPSREHVSVRG